MGGGGVTGALFSISRWEVCQTNSFEVNCSTYRHDLGVAGFQLEEENDFLQGPRAQPARLDVSLACFWKQACAANRSGTVSLDLLEV